ncbi:hypothetical protein E1B28_011259 [Marasmius oreades]|uniref:Carbohydrate kinase PfkB domain-containing protein n=1 Tax=Marasmius oreades TaxID=181124 RepID=A0A9P7RTW5_9AGAR|nr:uncharacterized protein E1B28_011259 [Marasmius oreades]KAG7089592.1 hypothetical protein E1B28_011259 [Marasmius oreades]
MQIIASGTLFLTHTLSVPCHPAPSTVIRAHAVEKSRGGSASMVLSLLAQFPCVDTALVASLGGNDEGQALIRQLEKEGVITRFCKVWRNLGVPSAWVLHASENDTRTVINHNPLPDITHDEFISLLGPLLAPENYPSVPPPSPSPTVPNTPLSTSISTPRPSFNVAPFTPGYIRSSPAPFDWLHFEGRSVKTTLSNITGLNGLARERRWRSHCVFSVDVGRKGRQGVEALIPHADVIFVNKHYAQANSPHYATTPRAFLLSLTSIAPPHALLVAHWGSEGAAVLSLPTQEYFQSSGWVAERRTASEGHLKEKKNKNKNKTGSGHMDEITSVRSGSDFWANGRSRTPSLATYSARECAYGNENSLSAPAKSRARSRSRSPGPMSHTDRSGYRDSGASFEDETDSQTTEVPEQDVDDGVVDEVGAQDAFVAGMIYALSRRMLPGAPYAPTSTAVVEKTSSHNDKGKWRLDECLRFATELAGRKARRRHWEGLADEMVRAGWLE